MIGSWRLSILFLPYLLKLPRVSGGDRMISSLTRSGNSMFSLFTTLSIASMLILSPVREFGMLRPQRRCRYFSDQQHRVGFLN